MLIIPAIDIRGGKCVRLFQGGAFTLACFDIAYIVRTVFADRLKKD